MEPQGAMDAYFDFLLDITRPRGAGDEIGHSGLAIFPNPQTQEIPRVFVGTDNPIPLQDNDMRGWHEIEGRWSIRTGSKEKRAGFRYSRDRAC